MYYDRTLLFVDSGSNNSKHQLITQALFAETHMTIQENFAGCLLRTMNAGLKVNPPYSTVDGNIFRLNAVKGFV